MFKKNKFKGGLLSDVVSPEVFQEMTGADCNQGGCKPSNQNEGSENSEAKPAEGATAPATDATPPATETKADTGTSTTENTDDASWKSKPSEPASENTDDGNQGCKKSSNQSEYAEEIGLVEATQILSDIEIDIEKKEVAGEEVPTEELDLVESMQTAAEATTEIVEQKDIMDEAVANDELTPTAVSIFKENCEDYLEKVNGECKNEAGETVPYIDSESAGLESDSKQALKAKYNAIWDVTRKTVDKTIYTVKKYSKNFKG
jgi:hypothetical protein